jgi:hypothetical protein
MKLRWKLLFKYILFTVYINYMLLKLSHISVSQDHHWGCLPHKDKFKGVLTSGGGWGSRGGRRKLGHQGGGWWVPSEDIPLLPNPPLHACDSLTWPLSLTRWFPAQHTLTLVPCLFLNQQKVPFQGLITRSSPTGSLSCVSAQWFHSVHSKPMELMSTLPFSSCFLYNLKFPASQWLGLPRAFILIHWSAHSTLKMEVICPSEMSVNFQQITLCYITEDSTLHNNSCET